LTRNDDTNVLLGERVRLINKIRPDFYVSIHQNVFASENVNGSEIYCYERDSEAIKLSEVVNSLISKVGIKSRGIKTGNYYLLRECKVSGIIIECMYVSGNEDRNKYNDETYKKIANAIFEGICRYYNIVPQD
jgi:stage II sporulation protein D